MRSIWKGAISFGLVHIPIRLYSASMQRELKFKMLHKKDLSEIRYARICKAEEKEVPWDQIVKGFEVEEGQFVVMTDEDFEKADVKKTRTIEILDFTDEKNIDAIFYDTPYYLEPEKGAASAYNLLNEALTKSKKVAVGRFVFHNHEHLGVIRPYNNLLLLQQLRYHSQIIDADEIKIPKEKVSKVELDLAIKLIKELTKPFKPEKYFDTYEEEIKEIIRKKAKGQKIKKAPAEKEPKVLNILALLKESLKKPKKRKAA